MQGHIDHVKEPWCTGMQSSVLKKVKWPVTKNGQVFPSFPEQFEHKGLSVQDDTKEHGLPMVNWKSGSKTISITQIRQSLITTKNSIHLYSISIHAQTQFSLAEFQGCITIFHTKCSLTPSCLLKSPIKMDDNPIAPWMYITHWL